MAGLSVALRLQNIKRRMATACERCGRDPASVRLLAVSKLHSGESIRDAYNCGQLDFAENFAQEALFKQAQMENVPLRWHFIGRIQSNKVKMMANRFAIIHSVDRFSVAYNLNHLTTGQPQEIFLQFNVAEEETKGGASELELENLVSGIGGFPNLRILGLMILPPLNTSPENARAHFSHAKVLLQRLQAGMATEVRARHPMNQLSMGTSHDFEVAIEEGATWIRIGTELFGPRADDDERRLQ